MPITLKTTAMKARESVNDPWETITVKAEAELEPVLAITGDGDLDPGFTATDLTGAVNELKKSGKVLWENQSPTSSFSAQNIVVPNMNDYDLIYIFCRASTGVDVNSVFAYIFKNDSTMIGQAFYFSPGTSFTTTVYYYRRFTANFSQNTIIANDAYAISTNSSVDNVRLIPVMVIGYNLS